MFNPFKKKERALTVAQFQDAGLMAPPTNTGQRVTQDSAMAIPAVFACVRVLSESCGALPLITYQRGQDGTKKRARQHNLYKILHDMPNPFMDAISFFELMVAHAALRGNSFARVERRDGEVVALWPLLPQNMVIKVEKEKLIYEYTVDGKKETFSWRDILHIKGLTFDGVVGLSPLSLLRETIGRAQAINEYSGKYFANDAKPGGVLSHPAKLGPDAYGRLKKAWNSGYQGSGKAHKVAILEEGMSFQAVGLSPEDSQMLDSQKFSVVEICRAFRVPLNLVQDHERSTYSNVTEQNRSFVVHTLGSWLKRIEQACNRILFTESEQAKFFVEHKLDSLLKGDQKTRYECYQIGIEQGFLSKNDIRNFENLSPVHGGDDYKTAVEQKSDSRSRAVQEGYQKRDKIRETFKPLIKEAVKVILARECKQIKRTLEKNQRAHRGNVEFKTWLQEFYSNVLPEFLKTKYEPVLRSFAMAITDQAEIEMDVTGTDLESYINEHIDHVVDGHTAASLNQLVKLLESDGGMDAVEIRLEEWEADDNRANKIAENQGVSTANRIFAGVAFYHGYKIMVQARGGACKFCKSISGTIVGRGEYAVNAGIYGEMTVKSSMSTPGWHRGCTCYLIHI